MLQHSHGIAVERHLARNPKIRRSTTGLPSHPHTKWARPPQNGPVAMLLPSLGSLEAARASAIHVKLCSLAEFSVGVETLISLPFPR